MDDRFENNQNESYERMRRKKNAKKAIRIFLSFISFTCCHFYSLHFIKYVTAVLADIRRNDAILKSRNVVSRRVEYIHLNLRQIVPLRYIYIFILLSDRKRCNAQVAFVVELHNDA